MPSKPDKGLPVPGDLVRYKHPRRGVVELVVSAVVDPMDWAGYSEIYFEGCVGSTFNINWTTLNANVGSWRIVTKPKANPKPREFKLPDQPSDLKRVQARDGSDDIYTWDGIRWRDRYNTSYEWSDLFIEHENGFAEVIETPYEAAVAYFKGGGALNVSRVDAIDHAKAIIEKVIADAE